MTDDDMAGLFALHELPAPELKADAVPSSARRGMTAREVRALFAAHGLPAPSRGVVAAATKASAMAALSPVVKRRVRPSPSKPAHRPIKGFSRTLDAACLYRELRRRGLKCREASSAVHTLLGTARSQVLKYQHHCVEPASVEHDRKCAEFVVALYWTNMIRHGWRLLEPKARSALMPIARRSLLAQKPPT